MLNNLHIDSFDSLASPEDLKQSLPMTAQHEQTVLAGRHEIKAALRGDDPRLLVIIGPCSIHDPAAALDYARRLSALRKELAETLIIVMRVYFEKPRTTIGWKGLINDPKLDQSFDINLGLHKARELLLALNDLELPCATEFLDPIVPQYTADLVSWAAIGARTTESQTHREMASGLSMPVGFKNATDGSLDVAINAMISAQSPHAFLGIDQNGLTSIVRTLGNPDVHVVLRGGRKPNYSKAHIAFAKVSLEQFDHPRLILVDCSHGNSAKQYERQPAVFNDILDQRLAGDQAILGVMIESNINAGRQNLGPDLAYGTSITDACIDWPTTEQLLRNAHQRLSLVTQ